MTSVKFTSPATLCAAASSPLLHFPTTHIGGRWCPFFILRMPTAVPELTLFEIGSVLWSCTIVFGLLFGLWWLLARRWHPRFAAADNAPANSVQRAASSELRDESTSGSDPGSLPRAFDLATRADFCSRCNSTIHCAIVVVGLAIAMPLVEYSYDFAPLSGDLRALQGLMAFSMAYFACDLLVVVGFCVPLWPVFAIHHVAAMVAIGSNLFQENCRRGSTLAIGLFLMVEIATIPLNVYTYAGQLGFDDLGLFQSVSFYLSVVCWFFTRLVLPIFVDVVLFTRVVMPLAAAERYCYIPGLTAALYLTLFCWVVFIGVFVPQIVGRCRSAPSSAAGGVHTATEPTAADDRPAFELSASTL